MNNEAMPAQTWKSHLRLRPWLGGLLFVSWVFTLRAIVLAAGPWVAAITFGAAIVVSLFLFWRACDWLFGPVLFYELVRSGRRGRLIWIRITYALLLLLFFWLVYAKFDFEDRAMWWLSAPPGRPVSWQPVIVGGRVTYHYDSGLTAAELAAHRAKMLAKLAETFFFTFMCVQFAAVLLLTPAYAGGAIAEEKDRRRLEFLLATDLNNREIVLAKLAACVANLALVLITGVPILGITLLLGGVDPNLLFGGFVATAVTMLSLASLSILNSVYARKPRDAILMSYLFVIAYLLVSLLARVPFAMLTNWRTALNLGGIQWLVEAFGAGNPIIMLGQLREEWMKGTPVAEVVPPLLIGYTIFHLLIVLICATWAVLRMRAAAWVRPGSEGAVVASHRRWWRFVPHSPGREPMLWKEIFAEPGLAFTGAGKVVVALIILASFAPALWIFGKTGVFVWFGNPWRETWPALQESLNLWIRLTGSGVAALTLIGVAVRAAGTISGETERQTLDSLLTTNLGLQEILFAKWLGSILSVRWAWVWLSAVWMLGVFTGGLHLATLPWLILAWSVYAAAFASIGMWFSAGNSGTLRATLLTLGLLAVLCFSHWLPSFFIKIPHTQWPWTIQTYGLTPPAALAWLAFNDHSVAFDPLDPGARPYNLPDPIAILLGIVIGMGLWCVLALILWRRTAARFRALSGRGRQGIAPKAPAPKLLPHEAARASA
jgi:ABC-type transport system involved in multi-copper enzyme maturation permease subunit